VLHVEPFVPAKCWCIAFCRRACGQRTCVPPCCVDDGPVLDVGKRADHDRVQVRAQHAAVPYAHLRSAAHCPRPASRGVATGRQATRGAFCYATRFCGQRGCARLPGEERALSNRSQSPMQTALGAIHVSGARMGSRWPSGMSCRCRQNASSWMCTGSNTGRAGTSDAHLTEFQRAAGPGPAALGAAPHAAPEQLSSAAAGGQSACVSAALGVHATRRRARPAARRIADPHPPPSSAAHPARPYRQTLAVLQGAVHAPGPPQLWLD